MGSCFSISLFPSHPQQVPNNAGGFVWSVDEMTRLRRFLILGTESGTYYVGEKELTLENAKAVVELLSKGVENYLERKHGKFCTKEEENVEFLPSLIRAGRGSFARTARYQRARQGG